MRVRVKWNRKRNRIIRKPNRVITYSVNGGFRKKEPKAPEIKDIWSFLLEKFTKKETDCHGNFTDH